MREDVKLKFVRTVLGTLKTKRHDSRDTWANVPMQDFTSKSDIDWTRSVHEIDLWLHRKNNLSRVEISFVEYMIRPMEWDNPRKNEMASALNLSVPAISKQLAKFREIRRIRREEPDKGGHWVILDL